MDWIKSLKDRSADLYSRKDKLQINKHICGEFRKNGGKCLILDSELGLTTQTLLQEGVSASNIISVNLDSNVVDKLNEYGTHNVVKNVFEYENPPRNVWLDLVGNLSKDNLEYIRKGFERQNSPSCWYITVPSRRFRKPKSRKYCKLYDMCKYYSDKVSTNGFYNDLRWVYGPSNMVLMRFRNYGKRKRYYRKTSNGLARGMKRAKKYLARHLTHIN